MSAGTKQHHLPHVGAVLSIEGLSVVYRARGRAVTAVRGFDLDIGRGEAHGLVGESGCGKSTVAFAIMRYLGGNAAITSGAIRLEGRDLLGLTAREIDRVRGARIAMVYQEPMSALNPGMRVGEQLAEVVVQHDGSDWSAARARAARVLDDVQLPDAARILAAYPHQLSGGQQQRVVIAMALLAQPGLLLLDEPTTALDVTVEAGIMGLIRQIAAERDMALLLISHNMALVRETCDRVTVMYAGEAVETGRVGDIFENMRHPYTRGLLAAIPRLEANKVTQPLAGIPGQVPAPGNLPAGCGFGPRCSDFAAGVCDRGRIPMQRANGHGRVGHLSRCARVGDIAWDTPGKIQAGRNRIEPGNVRLRVEALCKDYRIGHAGLFFARGGRTLTANADVSFEAREAETVAIAGESGCGKTTLAKVMLGLEEATGGRVVLGDVEIARLPAGSRDTDTIRRLQMVFQNVAQTLNPSHAVGSQLSRVIEKLGGIKGRAQVKARMEALLDAVRLPHAIAARYPDELSGGQKQRVGIARAFAGDPEVVVADEPVSALDVSVQAAILELLVDMQGERGTTLVFISHDLAVVRYLADRVVVMYLGRVVEQGRTEDVMRPPYHPYTQALLAAVPRLEPGAAPRRALAGEPGSAMAVTAGCPFFGRCVHRIEGICDRQPPPERVLAPGHAIACHLDETVLARLGDSQ